MGDEPTAPLGENAKADLAGRAKELAGVLDEIAELQEQAKDIKADAKAAGYDMKAFNQVVKERRRGAEFVAAQLELELVIDTYRKAVGVETDFAKAQQSVREAAESLPDKPKREKAKGGKGNGDTVVPFKKDLN